VVLLIFVVVLLLLLLLLVVAIGILKLAKTSEVIEEFKRLKTEYHHMRAEFRDDRTGAG
jgi:hypothetical protein